jgi:PAS domain S-box-containing protein
MIFEHNILVLSISLILVLSLIWLLIVRRGLVQKNRELKNEIKKRINAEEELKESSKMNSKLIDSVGEGIGIVNEKEEFIFVNKAAELIFDCEAGELNGKNLSEFLTVEETDKIQKGTKNRKKGFSDRYELSIVTAKGNTKTIEVTASPNYDDDGKFVSSYGVFRDVTAYKEARIKLEESRELFRTLLNNAPLPIFYKDSKGRYSGCNNRFSELIGMKEDDVIGKTVYDIAPKELAELYDEKDKLIFKNGGVQIYDWKMKNASGEIRNVVFHKAGLTDFFGNITGLIGAVVDVTDIKQYENKLKIQQAELERSNGDLEKFAYTVSHDLQEPLRMVSGFTDLLLKKYGSILNDEAITYINYAVDGARRMQAQIQGLLAYSRVTTQGSSFEKVSLTSAVEGALKNLSAAVDESGARIAYKDLPEVLGDRHQLISVFQNLIGNAIKFRKENEPLTVEIGSERSAGSDLVSIFVRDNGIGIDPKHKDNIFLIFYRLHSQEKYPGTGIGLAIVKKIIERHGGQIEVLSEKGKGTEFKFSLKGEGSK